MQGRMMGLLGAGWQEGYLLLPVKASCTTTWSTKRRHPSGWSIFCIDSLSRFRTWYVYHSMFGVYFTNTIIYPFLSYIL